MEIDIFGNKKYSLVKNVYFIQIEFKSWFFVGKLDGEVVIQIVDIFYRLLYEEYWWGSERIVLDLVVWRLKQRWNMFLFLCKEIDFILFLVG